MNTWDKLSMAEKADIMRLAVQGGIYDLDAIRNGYNEYAKGGRIHIAPSKRGTFTAAASKHGKSVQEFASQVLNNPENYSPAMRKKANFARNAAKWHHAYGGELDNYYDDGGILDKILGWLGLSSEKKEEQKPKPLTYRNRPAAITRVFTPEKQYLQKVPKRIRANTSKTKAESEKYENEMRLYVTNYQGRAGGSNPAFDIPYIPEKKILIGSTTTSTNALDSIAKYAGIHNRNPQLSEYPIKRKDSYPAPRKINKDEMLGLSFQETSNGAWPYINTGHGGNDRAIANSNYFTAFGYIPADNFMRDFHYNDTGVNRETPPILDAFRYYAQGDYNRNDPNHTRDVNAAGKRAWENQDVKNWWELSGKYWYNNGKGPRNSYE